MSSLKRINRYNLILILLLVCTSLWGADLDQYYKTVQNSKEVPDKALEEIFKQETSANKILEAVGSCKERIQAKYDIFTKAANLALMCGKFDIAQQYFQLAYDADQDSWYVGVVCNVTVNAAKQITLFDAATSDVAFSTVTLSGTLNVSGQTFQYATAMFYYMETDGNPTASEIKQNGFQSTTTRIQIPDNEALTQPFTAKVSNLAVNTSYCYVAAVELSSETYFGEVGSFTTADLPEIPEKVDMGFGPKWRGWNVGASKAEDYGNYYAWGETYTKDEYSWETYKFRQSYNTMTKYVSNPKEGYPSGFSDGKVDLESVDDAATQNLGSSWRMPTYQEMQALYNYVDMKWTRYKGVYGIVMTSKIEGYSNAVLFFPAGGYRSGTGSGAVKTGVYGQYWTASVNVNNAQQAGCLVLQKQVRNCTVGTAAYRYEGYNVRPVAAE